MDFRGQTFLMNWEFMTCAACMYVGMKVPYTTGIDEVKPYAFRSFHECSLKELKEGHASIHGQIFAFLDLMCDILFIFDLFINFLTARWVIETR